MRWRYGCAGHLGTCDKGTDVLEILGKCDGNMDMLDIWVRVIKVRMC